MFPVPRAVPSRGVPGFDQLPRDVPGNLQYFGDSSALGDKARQFIRGSKE
ncbi:MAG: hypothetical protein J0H49_24755 [Acidobacteria bacterium]|nr:hypothetical protein [Acidobacteriota bacterium]